MSFAAVYVPYFMVQAVVRSEPDLRDRAVALVEGTAPLWKIVAANEGALQAGIGLGMGGSQAAQFNAVEIRPRSQIQEKAAHAALLDIGWSVSPRIEDAAPDTMVLDIAGMTLLFKSARNLAKALAERASGVGLWPQIAVASKIEVAIHAARGFAGVTVIPLGQEAARMGQLPVEVLLASEETLQTLHRWGIRTCGALAALPLLELSERLGQEGVRLHQLASGTYDRSFQLAEPESCFSEELALDYTITELELLTFLLWRLLERLCARLQARSLAASAFCLRFDLKDSIEEEISSPRKQKCSDSIAAPGAYERTLRLPVPMRDSKTLLKLLRLQLQSDPPRGSIIKVTLTAEPARPRAGQKGLFVPDAPDPERLEVTIARLAGLVGNANVGSPRIVDTHRPGEFSMLPFLPTTEESVSSRTSFFAGQTTEDEIPDHPVGIAFRSFRPELPANVELWKGCPRRVYFHGARGNAITVSGPWRTSGDWWEQHGWRQDEWDVELHFDSSGPGHASRSDAQDGIYRIYYDWMRRDWFVRGRYD